MLPKVSSIRAILLGANMIQSRHIILKVWLNLGKDFHVAKIQLTTFDSNKHMADLYFLWEVQFGIHSSQCLNSQIQTDINVFAVDCFSFFETKMQTEKASRDLSKNSFTIFLFQLRLTRTPKSFILKHTCLMCSLANMVLMEGGALWAPYSNPEEEEDRL